MIDYSLTARLSKPNDKSSEKRVYANAQMRELMTLDKFSRHIAEHGSPYTRDVIVGVITAMVDCLHEQLLLGNKVQLGEMGSFYVTLSCEGVESADTFNPANDIRSVNVRWDKGRFFGNLRQEAEFNYVATRELQAKAKKEEKEALNQTVGTGGGSHATGGEVDPGDITP